MIVATATTWLLFANEPLAAQGPAIAETRAGLNVPSRWLDDFALQPPAQRPKLEVRYTGAERKAFEIEAARYHLIGKLTAPHTLGDAATGDVWIDLAVGDFAARNATSRSRINLYRRGPYYCEVHWLDLRFAIGDDTGTVAPLRGDLTLFCYPDKLLASLTLHALEDFAATEVHPGGRAPRSLPLPAIANGASHTVTFPVFGESAPLPTEAMQSHEAESPLAYDSTRGCYTVGTRNPGGFEAHFYKHPNFHETAKFTVRNDATPRVIHICHETSSGARGVIEGGVLLDEDGHPLPITVQISKNFAGEKEEKFYNPTDQPFSETYFPLVLGPNETVTVSSLHLYQNWGRKMVKQFSSLGAWTDYFHSSTGVTETTCFVPFKFGGIGGVSIADFRAMSQESFWGGQPQHDNVAGHTFLSYSEGEAWRHLVYQGATYHSTGPNWMDIEFRHLSSDGKIRASVRSFEFPQKDELRNFLKIEYEALKPVTIDNAPEHFRLLGITSTIQRLRYTHATISGGEPRLPGTTTELTFEANHYAVRGEAIAGNDGYAALHGEPKGSNALILRDWKAPGSISPAISVHCGTTGDTQMFLVPKQERITLAKGDRITFDAMLLPYGEIDGARSVASEAVAWSNESLKVVSQHARDQFPARLNARDSRGAVEVEIHGGRDLLPLIVTGLRDYRWPKLEENIENRGFIQLFQNRVTATDGAQVFVADDGSFGAVFLVDGPGDGSRRSFRGSSGAPWKEPKRLPIVVDGDTLTIDGITLSSSSFAGVEWKHSAGNSLAAGWSVVGGRMGFRITPNEDNADLQVWFRNSGKEPAAQELNLALRNFRSAGFHSAAGISEWPDERKMLKNDSDEHLIIAWPPALDWSFQQEGADHAVASLRLPVCPPNRRAHAYGKLYKSTDDPGNLANRIERELTPVRLD